MFQYWEVPAGQPRALRAWFYPGDNFGQEFAYPKQTAAQIAAFVKTPVPAIEVETSAVEDLKTVPLVAVDESGKTTELALTLPERQISSGLHYKTRAASCARSSLQPVPTGPPMAANTRACTETAPYRQRHAARRLGRTRVIGPVCRPWISLQAPASLQGLGPAPAIRRGRFQAGHGAGGVTVLRDILILGLAVVVRTLAAQVPAVEASEQPFKLSATAELVLLDVSVKDAAGEHVSNLSKNNFRVYEDGKLQTISHFASDDVPVTVGLVIDTSGSMRPKYAEVVTAALVFIQASNRSDEIFVVNFGDRVSLGLPDGIPFTGDIGQLRTALSMGTACRPDGSLRRRSSSPCIIWSRASARRRP